MLGYVYILKSLKSNTYYIGSTGDLRRRLLQHASGNVASTKNRRPHKLVFYQRFSSIEMAGKMERKMKRWKRKDFLEKIIKDGKIEHLGA